MSGYNSGPRASGDGVHSTDGRVDAVRRQKRAAAESLAVILGERYRVHSVYLFGSVARESDWREPSDIDLAVEGLPPERYFEALAELYRALPPGTELDLVPLEFASPELDQVVRTEGVLLHHE